MLNSPTITLSGGVQKLALTEGLDSPKPDSKKKADIVVCAVQYLGNSFIRGLGDVAHARKAADFFQRNFPGRVIKIIIQDNAESEKELDRIKKIITGEGEIIEHIIEKKTLGENNETIKRWLSEADFIFHAPSQLIKELSKNIDKYKSKLVQTFTYEEYKTCITDSEYKQLNSERPTKKENSEESNNALKKWLSEISLGYRGHITHEEHLKIYDFGLGLSKNRLYLNNREIPNSFKNTQLRDLFQDKINNSEISISPQNDNPIIYAYAGVGSEYFFLGMFRYIAATEGKDTRDIHIISPITFGADILDEREKEKLETDLKQLNTGISLTIHYNEDQKDKTMFISGSNNNNKNIFIINPFQNEYIADSDISLLYVIASMVHTTGDISFSDCLSIGKIPIPHKKKPSLKEALHDKIELFWTNNPYLHIWDKAYVLISKYTSFQKGSYNACFSEENKKAFLSLRLKGWQAFQKEFTQWVKDNNTMEAFLEEHAKKHLAENNPPCELTSPDVTLPLPV